MDVGELQIYEFFDSGNLNTGDYVFEESQAVPQNSVGSYITMIHFGFHLLANPLTDRTTPKSALVKIARPTLEDFVIGNMWNQPQVRLINPIRIEAGTSIQWAVNFDNAIQNTPAFNVSLVMGYSRKLQTLLPNLLS